MTERKMNTKKQMCDLNSKKNRFYIGLHEKTLLEDESNGWTPCYWYPLKKIKEDIPVLFFNADYFENGDRLETLKEIFINHNISSVTVIPELEDDYIEDDFPSRIVEQDEDGYIFPYFSERFIYDNTKEWMIYTSHEFTITFAGKWLIEEICKNLSRSREKEAAAKQTFTFPGAIPTKSEVRSTTDTKCLDFGGVTKRNL